MKFVPALIVAGLLVTAPALAQTGPGGVPYGAGEQRGIQELNNTGQTGFATLLSGRRFVVAIESAHGRREKVALQRGKCDSIQPQIVEQLPDLGPNGISRGMVHMSHARLFSGNYVVVVYTSTLPNAHPAACGELYQ